VLFALVLFCLSTNVEAQSLTFTETKLLAAGPFTVNFLTGSPLTSLQFSVTLLLTGTTGNYGLLSLQVTSGVTTVNLISSNGGQWQTTLTAAPGIVVLNFDVNAPISITSTTFPYSGTFAPSGSLATLLGNSFTSFTLSATNTAVPAAALLGFSVTRNCVAKVFAPILSGSSSVVSNSRLAFDTVVRRGSGINSRLTGVLISVFSNRKFTAGVPSCAAGLAGAAAASFTDAAIIGQFFPETGPMVQFTLDSGVSANITTSTWASGALSVVSNTYFVRFNIAPQNQITPNTGPIRNSASLANLDSQSPYGTWRVIFVDDTANSFFWCVSGVQITLQTCGVTGANPCC